MADGWTVTGQRQTVDWGADGHFHDVVEVSAVTTGGTGFRVRVRADRYTVEEVRRALDERAAVVSAVEDL